MKAVFWHSGHPREKNLSEAVAAGAGRCGDQIELRELTELPELVDCEMACLVGVKSRDWFRIYGEAGKRVAIFDKGYVRHRSPDKPRFWRIAVGGQQPVAYVNAAAHDSVRWDSWDLTTLPWGEDGSAILIAGSSAKAMAWAGIMDATEWVRDLVKHIRALTDRPIIYRPKPSWRDAKPVPGTEFSQNRHELWDCMKRSHVMITHSSNACFDAVLAGLPAIVLGEGIAKPISSTSVEDIDHPRRADANERKRWLSNVAWCQFTLPEFAEGLGWRQIRTMIEAEAYDLEEGQEDCSGRKIGSSCRWRCQMRERYQ